MKEPRTMGERIKAAREDRHLGVNELNRLVRHRLVRPGAKPLSDGYISRLENEPEDREIPAQYAIAIADVLGVRTEWLVDGKGPRRFRSGEMPAMVTAARRDKPNLECVLEASNIRGRWGEQTLAAARASETDLSLEAWPAALDQIEKAIRRALSRITR